jgi:hypothetical protein
MAHFYGMISRSARKHQATARGHSTTGLATIAASWQGAVEVTLSYDQETKKDYFKVSLIPWHGSGTDFLLAEGPVDGSKLPR